MGRLIDAYNFKYELQSAHYPSDTLKAGIVSIMIDNAPTVDAVPVVKKEDCYDCKNCVRNTSAE